MSVDAECDPSDPTQGGIGMRDFRDLVRQKMALLKLDDSFAARYVNEGFSGGEKKRLEMLQMAMLQPEFAILDETDSGLDIDALRIVAEGVNAQLSPDLGVLAHHPLPAPARLHQARRGPCPGPWPDHQDRRQRAGPASWSRTATRRILRAAGYGGGPSRRTRPCPPGEPDEPIRASHERTPRSTQPPSGRLPAVPRGLRWAGRSPISTAPRPRSSRRPCWTRSRLQHPLHGQHPPGHLHHGGRGDGRLRGRPSVVARFLTRRSANEIVFVRNATEAINLVAYSWGRRNIRQADTIVLTELEHHSNLVPWQLLAQEKDADLEFVAIDDQGRLDQRSSRCCLRTRPKLVAFNHVRTRWAPSTRCGR